MIDKSLYKIPPQSIDAEQSIISGILVDNKTLLEVMDILLPNDFYRSAHQKIFSGILRLHLKKEPIDLVTLTNILRENNSLAEIGGATYLALISDTVPIAINAEQYARIVRKASVARRLIEAANEIANAAYEADGDIVDILDEAQSKIINITFDTGLDNFAFLPELVPDRIDQYEEMSKQKRVLGIRTGFADIDRITGGLSGSKFVVIAARPRIGKEQPLYSKVLTPNGWAVMGEIKKGDKVIGSDGNPCNVEAVFPQGVKPIHRVYFSDGTHTDCGIEHLWETQSRKERKQNLPPTVKTLKKIIQSGIYLQDKRKNHSIKYVEPINFKKRKLPIHPYVLGIYLGDGSVGRKLSNIEFDVLDKFNSLLPKDTKLKIGENGKDHSIKRKKFNKNPTSFFLELKNMGIETCLSYQKFIPHNYLYSSIEDRTNLLHGLIDSDGTIADKKKGNYIEYSTTSKKLKDDIIELARSLGGRATFTERYGKYKKNGETHHCRKNYRVFIVFNTGFIPCSSKKHLSVFNGNRKSHKKYIENVDFVGNYEAACISVSNKDGLYVTDNYILTHNTAMMLNMAANMAKAGRKVGIFSIEMDKEELVDRLISSKSGVNSIKLSSGQGITEQEWGTITSAAEGLHEYSIVIDDTGGIKIQELKRRARKMVKNGVEIIFIDQLSKITGGKGRSEYEQKSYIVNEIAILKKELRIPVCLLAQISRKIEDRQNKKPTLGDLKSTGSLEEDPDIILLGHRKYEYTKAEEDKHHAEWEIAKHRQGATYNVKMYWNGKTVTFNQRTWDE